MSFIVDWTERLQPVRTSLEQNTIINDPANYSKLTGTLDFLLNPQLNPRTIDVIQNQNADASQYRSVEVRYQPHWGDDDLVTTDGSLTCDSNNQKRDYIANYDVNLFAAYKFTLDEDYLRQNTEDGDSQQNRLERGFRKAMRICRESMSAQLMAKMAANIGSNPAAEAGAGAYTTLELINSAGGADVDNFDVMKNHLEDNYMAGPLAVLGLGNARKYFNRLAVGNLNTNAGVDIREVANQFGALFYKDHSTLASLGGANKVLAVAPGLTQFFGYNLFKGVFVKETPDSLIKGTMPDAIYPFDWDYKIEYDKGCTNGNGLQGAWVVTVFKYFDLFTVPERAFGDTYGELNDFNGIVGYNITQGA
jgi:hypothetical protein